jgi:hypothetical protein
MAQISTARVLLDKSLGDTAGQECVDWAIGLLERGHDGHYVMRLAGMLPPHNHFEIAALRDMTLTELGIADAAADDAVISYGMELLQHAVSDDSYLPCAFAALSGLYIANGYQKALVDFYLLHHTYEDLQYEEIQWYWDGATSKNIRSIMRNRAKAFLSAHTKCE